MPRSIWTGVIYVSKTSTPQKPYATWETAANTIEDAMAAAGAGMTVVVGDGEYPVPSEWKGSMIGPRGRLEVDGILCPTECANGTRVRICRHLDGTVSLVLNKPEKGTAPKVVFSNNPRVNR